MSLQITTKRLPKAVKLSGVFFAMFALVVQPMVALNLPNVFATPVTDHVVINEIMANPTSGQPEWVELYNPTSNPVPMDDWRINDGDENFAGVFLAGTSIGANMYLTFEAGDTTSHLNDTSDTLELQSDSSGTVVDSVSYSGIAEGETYARGYDAGSNWIAQDAATKDTSNGAAAAVTAPMISSATPASQSFSQASDIVNNPTVIQVEKGSADLDYLQVVPTGNMLQAMKAELISNGGSASSLQAPFVNCAQVANPYTCVHGQASINVTNDAGITIEYTETATTGTWTFTVSSGLAQRLVADGLDFGFEDTAYQVGGQQSNTVSRNFTIASIASGLVENVDDDITFPTIQEAIDASTTSNGEVLQLAGVPFNESPRLDKSLTINGTNGSVVNGQIRMTTDGLDVTISNLSMTNSTGSAVDVPSDVSLNSLTLDNLNIDAKHAVHAGGSGGASGIDTLTIKDSTAIGYYPVYVEHTVTNLNVTGNDFTTVNGKRGIVFALQNASSNVDVSNNTFSMGTGVDAAEMNFVKYESANQALLATIQIDNQFTDGGTPVATTISGDDKAIIVQTEVDPTDSHAYNISGHVYRDLALNDCDSLGECKAPNRAGGLEGWTVNLYKEDVAGAWRPIASATSNGDGKYNFGAYQEAGVYHECVVIQPGWSQSPQTWNGSGYLVNTPNDLSVAGEGDSCTTLNYDDTKDRSHKSNIGVVDTAAPVTDVVMLSGDNITSNTTVENCEAPDKFYVVNDTINFSANFSDAQTDMRKVEYRFQEILANGCSRTSTLGLGYVNMTNSNGTWKGSLDTNVVTDESKQYSVHIVGYDNAGNWAERNIGVIVDNTMPTSTLSIDKLVNPTQATVTISDIHPQGQYVVNAYHVNDSSKNGRVCGLTDFDSGNTTATCSISGLADGEYYLKANVLDEVGNNSAFSPDQATGPTGHGAYSEHFVVDTTKPSITMSSIPGVVNGVVTLSGTASDDGSGLRTKNTGSGNDSAGDFIRLSVWTLVNGVRDTSAPHHTYKVPVAADGSWTQDIDTVNEPWFVEGAEYSVVARANDNTGESYSTSYTAADTDRFTVDNITPTPPDGTNETPAESPDTGDEGEGGPDSTPSLLPPSDSSPLRFFAASAVASPASLGFLGTNLGGQGSPLALAGDNTGEANDDERDVLAARDGQKTDEGDVLAATDNKTDGCYKFLGLCWYWWVPIVVVIVGLIWLFLAGRNKGDDVPTRRL